MAFGALAGISAGLGLLQGVAGVVDARNQNRGLATAAANTRSRAATEFDILEQQRDLALLRNARAREAAEGNIIASAASRGVSSTEGSAAALRRQNEADAVLSEEVIRFNADNNSLASSLAAMDRLNQLSGARQNTILAGIRGAAGGAQQGAQLAGTYHGLWRAMR